MKLVLVALLVATQFASAAYGQDKPKPNDSHAAPTVQKTAEVQELADYDYEVYCQ